MPTETQSFLLCGLLDPLVFLNTIVFLVTCQEELIFPSFLFERRL